MHKLRFIIVSILAFFSMACLITDMAGIEGVGSRYLPPEEPTKLIAETQENIEVYVLLNADGKVVDFETGGPFGATANLRYQLEFWYVGSWGNFSLTDATIYRVYTPLRITGISKPSEYTAEQQAAIFSRTEFPETYVELHHLSFEGGPNGEFTGTNSETGKNIKGSLVWSEDRKELHAIFTEDIKQDYLVLFDEIPFGNWIISK